MKLPLACKAEYYRDFVSKEESAALFHWIGENCGDLESTEIVVADGTVHHVDTGKIMFVDSELTSFSLLPEVYGRRIAWPPIVRPLKGRIECLTGSTFGVCVCIYYKNGECGVGFHSDLPAFGPTSLLPSISLGERREFSMRRRRDPAEQFDIELADGSMLIMGEGFQDEYEHSLPINPKYLNPRINLTFRMFDWPPSWKREEGQTDLKTDASSV